MPNIEASPVPVRDSQTTRLHHPQLLRQFKRLRQPSLCTDENSFGASAAASRVRPTGAEARPANVHDGEAYN